MSHESLANFTTLFLQAWLHFAISPILKPCSKLCMKKKDIEHCNILYNLLTLQLTMENIYIALFSQLFKSICKDFFCSFLKCGTYYMYTWGMFAVSVHGISQGTLHGAPRTPPIYGRHIETSLIHACILYEAL